MGRVIVFGVLIVLWTLLCVALFVVVGVGSAAAGVGGMLFFQTDPQRLANLVAEFGALGASLIWLAGTIALVLVAWAMRARAHAAAVAQSGDQPPR